MSGQLFLLLLFAGSANPRLPLHPWGEPKSKDTCLVVLRNTAYDCGYSRRLKVPVWASYIYFRTGPDLLPRRESFRPDPRLDSAASALDHDYAGSGYDRGHLAPDAAIKVFGPDAQKETYYFSNIIPQEPRVNRGVWFALEKEIRRWAGTRDTIWAVAGPVWFAGQETTRLGRSRVAVPHACFASVRRTRTEGIISFLVPNQPEPCTSRLLTRYLVSVDSIERLTGLDLFPALANGPESGLESARPETFWRVQP